METVEITNAVQRLRRRKWGVGPRYTPSVIVVHDPGQHDEGRPGIQDDPVSALSVARFNATPPEQRHPYGVGGYHTVQDNFYTVICSHDEYAVNGAVGAADIGLHIQFSGYGDEAFSRGAALVSAWCNKWGIPKVKRTKAEWPAPGIYGHIDVPNNTHTDPRDFPWDQFMALVQGEAPAPTPVPDEPEAPVAAIATGQKGYKGRPATARPLLSSKDKGRVLLENGARIKGDKRWGGDDDNPVYSWRHADAGDRQLNDIVPRADGKGIVALHDDGDGRASATYDGLYP